MRTEIDRRAMTALSGGHLFVDFASGTIPALIPFITAKFDLSYAHAALLMLCVTISSSLVQPLFGLLSDRRGALWLIPGGVALAGAGAGLAAVSPVYPLVLVLVFASGIGIAAFHPEGAKFATYASGLKRASGMSYFNIGGNTGYALGAIVTTPLVVWLGLTGGLVAVLPVLAASLVLVRLLPSFRQLQPLPGTRSRLAGDDRRRAMALLALVIVLRSVAWFALLTFVPLWMVSQGSSEADGNHMLSLMLLAGAVGTLALGPIADRFGLRRTLLVTQALLPPLVLTFIYGVTMVLSQLYLPRHVGMASGLAVGLAMGLGGVAAVALGAVADAVDLQTALTISALAPALGVVVCLFLPAPAPSPILAAEPATT
jgi:FSR family fosmidomycin resistance protein-like MFS transporter